MGTPTPKTDLARKLKAAAEPESTVRVRAKTSTTVATQDDAKKFEKIEDNPFFQIAKSKDADLRLPNQKREAMVKLLSYDKSKSAEQNEAMARAAMLFLEYMEAQNLNSSRANIAGQNAKVSGEIREVIDQFSKGLHDFKEEIGPFHRRLQAIYNIRLSGRAVELLEEIISDRKTVEENKKLLETQTTELQTRTDKLNGLADTISSHQLSIAKLGQDFRWGMPMLGLRSESRQELAEREVLLGQATAQSTEMAVAIEGLKTSVAEMREKLGHTPGTQFDDLAEDKAEIQAMLNISSAEHIAAHEHLKDKTLEFIETSISRMDAVLGNVEEVNALTGKTSKRTGAMMIMGAIMNDAVKVAAENNQRVLVDYLPPTDPSIEDELTKAEREEMRLSVLRHIKTVSMVNDDTTKLRNSLTKQKDQFESMLTANEHLIRSTKQLRHSGVANMAAEMAVTMTALSHASNAEAFHISQTMVDEMGKTVLDIRSKEVMRQAAEMGIRNQELADLIVSTQQADKVARIGIEEQRKALTELNKNLSDITDVTAELQRTLKAGESVYAEAQADAAKELAERGPLTPANDDNPVASGRRKTGTEAPSLDIFS